MPNTSCNVTCDLPFFQAEDGIRDYKVTGVQTCALPIYQWLWSKHLALSYYSKPPIIAYLQFLGTHIWGDTEFGVRFFFPVIGALLLVLLFLFFLLAFD